MSVRELEDGRVLVHAFCGCSTEAILAALGLQLGDLFEKPLGHRLPPVRRAGLNAREALELLEHEIDTAAILMADMAAGRALTSEELQRLTQAAARVGALKGHAHA